MKQRPKLTYSVIIPVFNEEGNIPKLVREIKGVMKKIRPDFEIIIVDDGSTDGTAKILEKIRGIKLVQLLKNFGQSAALDAGIREAKGRLIITLDGDGQNDPGDIPRLIKKLGEGYDVVCGWRYKRRDSWSKIFISNVAKTMRSVLVDDQVHDAGCTLRIYRKECFTNLDLRGEMHRMIPAMLRWRGYRITEIKVNHRPRLTGQSKYGFARTMHGFLDMLLIWFTRKYSSRPLHLFGSLGVTLIFISIILFGYEIYCLIVFSKFPDRIWIQAALLSLFTGLQLFVSGILADLIIRNNTKSRSWMIRSIKER